MCKSDDNSKDPEDQVQRVQDTHKSPGSKPTVAPWLDKSEDDRLQVKKYRKASSYPESKRNYSRLKTIVEKPVSFNAS